ncbi:MAG TPA: hypothetical protein VNO79_14495 [Actinomycetota bacterium]|nr:hypothetical protein [Actinomycetota bacterium]
MEGWTEAPDRLGVVVAARCWRWSVGSGGPRLVSITRAVRWPARARLEAVCSDPDAWTLWRGRGRPPAGHPSPHPDCSCGIWGLAHAGTLLAQHRSVAYAYGTVALWGPVLCGPYGWRARYAYPQALVRVGPISDADAAWGRGVPRPRLAPPPLEELARAYGVPLVDSWPALTPPAVPAEGAG